MTDLAGWDAGEVESALEAVAVPVLAIQSTTTDTALIAGFALDCGRNQQMGTPGRILHSRN